MARKTLRCAATILFLLAAAAAAQAQFVYPVSGRLTQGYYTWTPYGYHRAIDIANGYWTAIGAARGGRVVAATWDNVGGYVIKIDHGNGYQTYYGHLIRFAVGYGQWVSTGQTIGYMGSTGYSTGPHTHFGVLRWGYWQYVPGAPGQWVTKGYAIPQSYAGLSGTAPAPTSSLAAVKITSGPLNVRSGPGTGYPVLGSVHAGQHYVSHSVSGSWRKIWYDGRAGWIYMGYATTVGGVSGAKVMASELYVRTGPGTGYARVGSVYSGQVYFWTQTSNGWYRIYWRGGQYCVYGGYITRISL